MRDALKRAFLTGKTFAGEIETLEKLESKMSEPAEPRKSLLPSWLMDASRSKKLEYLPLEFRVGCVANRRTGTCLWTIRRNPTGLGEAWNGPGRTLSCVTASVLVITLPSLASRCMSWLSLAHGEGSGSNFGLE